MKKKQVLGFNWAEKILILLWGGVELSFSVLMDLGDLFAYHSERWGWDAKEDLCTIQTLDRVIKQLKKENLIEEKTQETGKRKLKITHQGELAINWLTPHFVQPKGKWDGHWYLVVFDIPEEIRGARNLLRRKLRELGFGQLQKSVFISAYNSLSIIEDLARRNKIEKYIRTMVIDKIDNPQVLIEQAWPWPIMEEKIRKFLKEAQKYSGLNKKKNPFKIKELEKKLSKILEDDPSLPQDLTPVSYLHLKDKASRLLRKLCA